jgi:hypothetical protein
VNHVTIKRSCITIIGIRNSPLQKLRQTFAIKKKIMSTGKLFLGILAGVAAGLLLGMSFAPYPKTVAPQKIPKKEKDLANDSK